MAVPDGEDLLALLDALGVANAVLVGLSLGARTSLDFTLTHPGRVDGLVLAGPGMSGMTITDPFIRAEATRTMAALKAGDLPGFVDGFLRQWVDGPRRAPSEVDAGYPRALPGDGDADRRRAPQGRRGVDRGR